MQSSERIRALTRRLRRLVELVRELAAREPLVGLAAYGFVYNLSTGVGTPTIAAGGDITFSNNGVLNNVTHTPGTAAIGLPLPEDYEVIFQVTAAGAAAGVQITGTAIIPVTAANATITLRNLSGVPVPLLNILIGGVPFNNASLTVKKLGPVA